MIEVKARYGARFFPLAYGFPRVSAHMFCGVLELRAAPPGSSNTIATHSIEFLDGPFNRCALQHVGSRST
jgi:hypothetical protein